MHGAYRRQQRRAVVGQRPDVDRQRRPAAGRQQRRGQQRGKHREQVDVPGQLAGGVRVDRAVRGARDRVAGVVDQDLQVHARHGPRDRGERHLGRVGALLRVRDDDPEAPRRVPPPQL